MSAMALPTDIEPMVLAVRDAALQLVQDERGVRVEDYVTVLAAAAGEATLVDADLFDIEANDLTPGAGVFGDAINVVLTGDGSEAGGIPTTSTVGVLVDQLVPDVVALAAFDGIEARYAQVAAAAGSLPWGEVAVSVPDDHRPWVLPLRVAFELRPVVVAASEAAAVSGWSRHEVVAAALASAIAQAAEALDPTTSVGLALDVTFGMAKVVPMSRAAFDQAAGD